MRDQQTRVPVTAGRKDPVGEVDQWNALYAEHAATKPAIAVEVDIEGIGRDIPVGPLALGGHTSGHVAVGDAVFEPESLLYRSTAKSEPHLPVLDEHVGKGAGLVGD